MAWILHACMAGMVHNMFHKNHSVGSLYSIECPLKVKQIQRPKLSQGSCKDDWLIWAVRTLYSTSADVIGRHHYQISFTNVTLDMTAKRRADVSPISWQLTVHSTAEILLCVSAEHAI